VNISDVCFSIEAIAVWRFMMSFTYSNQPPKGVRALRKHVAAAWIWRERLELPETTRELAPAKFTPSQHFTTIPSLQ
jgi:hypothetical protein